MAELIEIRESVRERHVAATQAAGRSRADQAKALISPRISSS